MAHAARISARDARKAIRRNGALLVCAYDDQEKCDDVKLDGSISYPELERRLGEVDREQELIFYCA